VAALTAELPPGAVVVDPDVVDSYRFDRASTVVPGTPVALVPTQEQADDVVVLVVRFDMGP
jgi:glycolate oxidase